MEKHPMRRAKNEISDPLIIEQLLKKASVCHMGLSDDGHPYVVPMNYGYSGGCFYLHSAGEGRKLDILSRNNQVCIEVVIDYSIESADAPCNWTTNYTSVIGFGRAYILEALEEKEKALCKLMQAFTGTPVHAFSAHSMKHVCVIRVDIDDIRAKDSTLD